tara:strand:- start:311 stop:724 length:414 start_codon:yes stop_codon:yes gene_type:complete
MVDFFEEDLKFINNESKYWEFIRCLRNDKRVKHGFIKQNYISEDIHLKFMEKYGNMFYICLYKNKPAGYIGCINKDIRVAVHPDFQGNGIGSFMVNKLMELDSEAFAKVKLDNKASLRLFEKCGFEKKYYILEKDAP